MNIYDDIGQHNSTLSQIIATCFVSNFNISKSIDHYTTIPRLEILKIFSHTQHLICNVLTFAITGYVLQFFIVTLVGGNWYALVVLVMISLIYIIM